MPMDFRFYCKVIWQNKESLVCTRQVAA